MDSSRFKLVFILVIAFGFALYLGVAAATAQGEALAWVAGGVFFAVCLLLGRHVWILIPATLSMRGGINLLPGMIPPWVFMTMVAGGFVLMRMALRRQSLKFRWTWMETAMLLVALTIIQAMVRNPVGLRALGGDTAGSKPYFIYVFAFAAYFLIIISKPDFRIWKWAVILYLCMGILDGLVQALSAVYPSFAQVMVRIYSNVSFDEAMGQGIGYQITERRLGFLGQIGALLGLVACSYWRPLAALAIHKPYRALVAAAGVIGVLLSGFRSLTAMLFVQFLVGSTIRRRVIDVVVILICGGTLLAVVTMSGLTRELPFGVQRVLSVLPIDVDPRARDQAENSTQDRIEMWKIALTSDRYIKNKMIGDGFQFSAVEINAMAESRLASSRLRSVTFIERSLEVGNYHGFHVETIRFTGVIGLVAATIALIVFARAAAKAIGKYRDAPGWGHVIFICMPFLIYPLWYWFVFGSYRTGFPELLAMSGMVKLLLDGFDYRSGPGIERAAEA